MAALRVIQSRGAVYGLPVAVWAIGVGLCAALTLDRPEPALRHPAVLLSAGLTIGWIVATWVFLLADRKSLARLAWTLGLVTLLVHIALAFERAHQWSHAAAVEHVRQVGGFGGGIVVNYLFAAVWLADVVWWWAKPTSYANRSRWITRTVHGLIAFVVLNAAVIFGPPDRRWLYALWLVLVGVAWGWPMRRRETHEPGKKPGPDEFADG